MEPIVDVVSRISQLQTQLGLAAVLSGNSGTDGTRGVDFASQLAALQETGASNDGEADDEGTGSGVRGVSGNAVGSAVRATPQAKLSGADIVADARKYLGVPYVFGGTDPATGLDCSGLTQHVYGDLGVRLPRTAHEQAGIGQRIPSLSQAKPGDLLAFNDPATHIAIYAGDGMMIAAPHAGDHVKLQKVYATPSAIRRVIGADGTVAAGVTATARPKSLNTGALGAVPYANLFVAAGAKYGVSPKLLAAIAKVESNYNPRAVSKAGAQGLMQIMPATAKGLGVNPLDPAQAVDGAARIMAGNLKQFGSLPLAIAAYNAGGGAVTRYGGIPPFAETRAYVPKVEAALAALG
jgi:cell wall-associated NlpC family hydrolase